MKEPSHRKWKKHWKLILRECVGEVHLISLCNAGDFRGEGKFDQVDCQVKSLNPNAIEFLEAIHRASKWRFVVELVNVEKCREICVPPDAV